MGEVFTAKELIPENPRPDLFPNLAKGMSADKLSNIGNKVVEGFDLDLQSRSEWEEMHKEWLKLFGLQADQKNFPWPNASNVKLPVLNTAVLQFQARAFENLIPPKKIMKAVPIGKEVRDAEIADRVERYMNWQFMFDMKEFEESMDITLMKLPIDGTVIRKSYYDEILQRNVSDYISPSDFVVNYNTRYLEKSERYTQILRLTENDILIRKEAGLYVNTDNLDAPTVIEEDEIKEQDDKNTGIENSTSVTNDPTNPRKVLEQHVLMNLKEDNSKLKKPYIITVDKTTRQVLRIVERVNPNTGRTINYFTDYHFIRNPEGFYSYGFGVLLKGVNESINSILNQLIDSGTLSVIKGGFMKKRSGMKRGQVTFKMGEFKEIEMGPNENLRDALLPIDFGSPSGVLFQLLSLLQGYADRLSSVTEITTGQMPRSDTTATSILTLREEGQKLFSTIHKRIHLSFKRELQKLYELNGLYLNVQQYFDIVINKDRLVGPEGQPIPAEIEMQRISKDFNSPMDVQPVSDPSITSRSEKIAKAELVLNTALSNPIISQNEDAIREATRKFWEAIEVPDDMIEIALTPPPPPEPQDLSQIEEIQAFFNEQFIEALETQNHTEHLAVIEDFVTTSPLFKEMSSTGKNILERHKQQHLGFLFVQQEQQIAQEEQAIGQEAEALQQVAPVQLQGLPTV